MIIPIGWKCQICGTYLKLDGTHQDGNLYLSPDPSKTMALCLNFQLCSERQKAL